MTISTQAATVAVPYFTSTPISEPNTRGHFLPRRLLGLADRCTVVELRKQKVIMTMSAARH